MNASRAIFSSAPLTTRRSFSNPSCTSATSKIPLEEPRRSAANLSYQQNINQLIPGTLTSHPGVNVNALRPYPGYADIFEYNTGNLAARASLQLQPASRPRYTRGAVNPVETRIRVRYAETDQMGVVYHAHYLVWMEVARVEFCRTAGFDYSAMERDDGIAMAVVEANCRFLRPARFDDEVVIATSLERANAKIICFSYEMRRAGEDKLLAVGFTKHLCVSRHMTAVRLPDKYRTLFGL